jgi:hypothetical protein
MPGLRGGLGATTVSIEPARKHRDKCCILQDKVVVEGSETVEYGDPQDRVAEPRVEASHGCARVVRNPEERWNREACEQRQGMALEPCTGNGRERDCEEEHIERRLYGFCRDVHPSCDLGKVRPRLDHSPQQADGHQREHGHSQRFVELPLGITEWRIDARLRSPQAVAERIEHQDCRGPVEELRTPL